MSRGRLDSALRELNKFTTTVQGGEPGTRSARLRDLAMTATSLHQLGTGLWEITKKQVENRGYSIEVEEGDDLFDYFQRWLVEQVPPERIRNVNASTRKVIATDHDFQHKPPKELVLVHQSDESLTVYIDGHKVTVSYEEPDLHVSGSGEPGEERKSRLIRSGKAKLVFNTRDRGGYQAIVRFMERELDKMNAVNLPTSRMFISSGWGGWERISNEPRPLDTVILREGVKERIVSDMERFLTYEDRYVRLGIPYHRGYLLHGPPGTGKTSLVRAIANHFHLDLYYVNLADLQRDADITFMLNRMEPRSILLMEDIDAVEATQSRSEKEVKRARKALDRAGLTMTGILNGLDGAVTPSGLIAFMSTNHRERLDPALLRKGRVDMDVHIDYLGAQQLRNLIEQFLGEEIGPLPRNFDELRIPPVDVVEVLKLHLEKDEGSDAVQGVRELIQRREEQHGSEA